MRRYKIAFISRTSLQQPYYLIYFFRRYFLKLLLLYFYINFFVLIIFSCPRALRQKILLLKKVIKVSFHITVTTLNPSIFRIKFFQCRVEWHPVFMIYP